MGATTTDASENRKGEASKELRQAFAAAISAEEKHKLLVEMEQSGVEEKDLGSEYEELAKTFHSEGKFPEQALYFGKKALGIILDQVKNNGGKFRCKFKCLSIAYTLYVLGSVCRELNKFDESLSYLNWTERNLFKLVEEEEEEADSRFDGLRLSLLAVTELELFKVKIAMGEMEEASIHMRKILEVRLKTLEEGSLELGKAYKHAYVNYMSVMNTKEALPLCVKALEICQGRLGGDSVEVAEIRAHLVGLYIESQEYDKALEQSQLAQRASGCYLTHIQVMKCYVLIALGRQEEAIKALTVVVSHGDLEPGIRATALIYMALANLKMGKVDDAKKDMEIGQKILEELDANSLSPESRLKYSLCVAARFSEMSMLYEMMCDFENAIYFTRRVLAIPELPQKFIVNGAGRLASLLVLSGKAEQGISYSELEDVMSKFKYNFGPGESGLGYAYKKLGRAYAKRRRIDLSVKYMAYAKSIMDVSLGPGHLKSLDTSQMLALTYTKLGRFPLAVEIQEKVVETLRGLGPSVEGRLDEAVEMLNLIMSTKAGFERVLTNNPALDASDLVRMLDWIVEGV